MKTQNTTIDNNKDTLTVKPTFTFRHVKLFLLGLVIAAGFSSCVVYGHPYHHHYGYYR